jgi:hypothetical protein
MQGASMIGPVFMMACVTVFYLYNVAILVQAGSENRMMYSDSDMGSLEAHNVMRAAKTPWNSEPLRVLVRTHVGAPSSRRPCTAHVSVVVDNPTLSQMSQIEGMIKYSPPHLNLYFYVSVKSKSMGKIQAMSLNTALYNSSGASVPEGISVDVITLEMESKTKQQTRIFRMALHALHELQQTDRTQDEPGFVLLIHRSCVVDLSWNIFSLLLGGRGFLLLHSDITPQTLYKEVATHDLGVTSGSILKKRSAVHTPPPFHCSGSIMHALHLY